MPATPEAKLALRRINQRARMLSDTGEEDSVVIDQRARAAESSPAPAKTIVHILRAVDSWPKVFALAMILAVVAFAIGRGLLKIF